MDTVQGALLGVADNPMNRDMLTWRLARQGYTVTVEQHHLPRSGLLPAPVQQCCLFLPAHQKSITASPPAPARPRSAAARTSSPSPGIT